MMEPNHKYASTLFKWSPPVRKLDTGEITMLWRLSLESLYLPDGGFTSRVDLNYREVHVQMHWISDRECSLDCCAPGMNSWKNLYDSGYRGVLAIDRYLGRVAAINGVGRSVWWLAVFSVYSAFDGPQLYDANALMKAASTDDVQQLEQLLAAGAEVDAGDMIGVAALSCAAQSGKVRAFKFLITKGADVRVVTSGGGTVLHAAAAGGNVEILSILVGAGVDLNARAQSGHTPLGWAVLNSKAEAARYLLEAGADPKAERGITLCSEAKLRFGEGHLVTKLLCP